MNDKLSSTTGPNIGTNFLMKTFWWFKDDAIAGMARPGFNAARWLELGIREAAVLGWIGRYSPGRHSLESFRSHLRHYMPQVYVYHQLDIEAGNKAVEPLFTENGFAIALAKLNEAMQIVDNVSVENDHVQFEINQTRINYEIQCLEKNKIETIVSLTEDHHQKDLLSQKFETVHIGINDLGAPTIEQVMHLKEVVEQSKAKRKRIAVHCLAGIGRTSTMLIAAHMMNGESLDDLFKSVKKRNPPFDPSPSQATFLRSLGDQLKS